MLGDVHNLVLLVRFANQTSLFSNADFDPVFNGAVGSGSVRHYYSEVSYGKVSLVSTIVGWIDLPEDDTYYAYNESVMGHPEHMIEHAVAILNAQGFDFTGLDSDNDGYIDAIDIIHSGPGYETSGNVDHIHSHYYGPMWNTITTHDGMKIDAYHTEPEVRGDGVSITGIGVIVH
ncbi:hypothetical protein DRQ53_15240, partial [bacterium]